MTPTFRFAPSPTGYLHLGHALSAVCVWRAAEDAGGRVLLRIEDIDPARSKPEHVAAIVEDLDWLGFRWEGAPILQSERLGGHAEALLRLGAAGLLYPCKLSRADLAEAVRRAERGAGAPWPRDPDGAPRVPVAGAEPGLSEERHALRLDMAKAIEAAGAAPLTWREDGTGPAGEHGEVAASPLAWGDVVLARKDTPTSYHLAVVVDDAADGVTHVVRGQDLFHATSVHRLLQRLLDLPEPRYSHHRLVSDALGEKLAKSRGSPSLRSLRADGWSRQAVLAEIERLLTAPS